MDLDSRDFHLVPGETIKARPVDDDSVFRRRCARREVVRPRHRVTLQVEVAISKEKWPVFSTPARIGWSVFERKDTADLAHARDADRVAREELDARAVKAARDEVGEVEAKVEPLASLNECLGQRSVASVGTWDGRG